jgi:hypothetical protein
MIGPDSITIEGNHVAPPVKVKINETNKFFFGGTKPKWRLHGAVGRNEDLLLSLIERDFGKMTDIVMSNWAKAKEAGLPVVNIFRKTDKNTIVMTDIRADGSEIYGKSIYYHITDPKKTGEIRQSNKIDVKFLEIMNSKEKMEEVKKQAEKYALLASEHGIILAWDDPFDLVIHPTEGFKLICLDIEDMGHRDVSSEYELTEAKETNQNRVKKFIADLTISAKELLKTEKSFEVNSAN